VFNVPIADWGFYCQAKISGMKENKFVSGLTNCSGEKVCRDAVVGIPACILTL
jgi:hypothetical protein